jgi:hypothetical protein
MRKIQITEKQYEIIKQNLIESAILNEQSSDQVMEVQRRLKSCFGAYLGKSGPNKDGVDGIAGELTKRAIETYTSYVF